MLKLKGKHKNHIHGIMFTWNLIDPLLFIKTMLFLITPLWAKSPTSDWIAALVFTCQILLNQAANWRFAHCILLRFLVCSLVSAADLIQSVFLDWTILGEHCNSRNAYADLPSLSSFTALAPFFARSEATLSTSPCSTAASRRSSFLFHSLT